MDTMIVRKEGLRERKRRETRQRLAEVGLRFFVKNGYEATTLESIAIEAGISPRTLFYYFKTKDELLQFWHRRGFLDALGPAMLRESREQRPLTAIHNCLLKLAPRYETENSVIVDRILNSTESLRLRKQAIFTALEETLVAALSEMWPEPNKLPSHRIAAMIATGAVRLAMEARRQDNRNRSLAVHVKKAFARIDEQIAGS
jgi:AcrR family transcriptional regulator